MKKHLKQNKYKYFAGFASFALIMLILGQQTQASGDSSIGGEQSSQRIPQEALDNAAPQSAFNRFLVTPNSTASNKQLRSLLNDIRHEFDGQFTANIPKHLLDQVKTLGTVELVPIHKLHHHETLLAAKPVCGNGLIEGGEKCGEPGLLSCPEGQECDQCKCKDTSEPTPPPPPPGRLCTPSNQTDYNVTQVNGGQSGAGAGVTVAVLDTGVDTDHLDLINNITDCKDATKGRGIKNGCEDKDNVAHGTHSAGIVAADGGTDGLGLSGAAPGADLMIIKVCGNAGCFTDDIAAAINYAAQNGADVVNMSFGGSIESSLIKTAIANNPGLLYVASAGNSGPGANTIEFPAANPAVVAVAANDQNKIVASFSSRGIDDGNDATIVQRELELSAGGVQVESTNNDGCFSRLSGTSFSSPTVAGLAAKVWQGSASATRNHLISIAQDITQASGGGAGTGYDIASGYGLPVAP